MRHFTITFFSLFCASSIMAADNPLSYSNTDFNQTQPGWSDTLTISNHSAAPVTITQLQFDTNYGTLDTSQLYGSIQHPSTPVTPQLISPYDYRYTFNTPTTIPANASVNLTQIPIEHTQTSINGIPEYFRLPFHLQAVVNGNTIPVPLEGSCQNSTCSDPALNKLIGAYYTDWANYHYTQNPQNILMPNQIPLPQLNTIFYDVGKIDRATANLNFVDINHDQYYLPAFDTLKQQYPYLNLIYSFGGWGDAGSGSYPSYDLAAIFDQQNPALTQKLADNMVNMIQTLGFNGIDIDYEWNAIEPNGSMQLTPARARGFQTLLQDIRADLTKIQPLSNSHYYKLTIAAFAGPDKVNEFKQNGGDWKQVADALDSINVMTYDMHGQFDLSQPAPDNITDFHSPMHTDHAYQADMLNHYNVADAVKAYEAEQVPANKIVLGIPAYTRIEQSALPVTDSNAGLYLTLAQSQPAGESGSGGTTDYKCIINNQYCWNNFNFDRANLTIMPTNLSDSGLGVGAKTPWAYDKKQNWFMSFDDNQSAFYKGQWAKQNNLNGIMVWEIDGDLPMSSPEYQQNSIIYNAWKGIK